MLFRSRKRRTVAKGRKLEKGKGKEVKGFLKDHSVVSRGRRSYTRFRRWVEFKSTLLAELSFLFRHFASTLDCLPLYLLPHLQLLDRLISPCGFSIFSSSQPVSQPVSPPPLASQSSPPSHSISQPGPPPNTTPTPPHLLLYYLRLLRLPPYVHQLLGRLLPQLQRRNRPLNRPLLLYNSSYASYLTL